MSKKFLIITPQDHRQDRKHEKIKVCCICWLVSVTSRRKRCYDICASILSALLSLLTHCESYNCIRCLYHALNYSHGRHHSYQTRRFYQDMRISGMKTSASLLPFGMVKVSVHHKASTDSVCYCCANALTHIAALAHITFSSFFFFFSLPFLNFYLQSNYCIFWIILAIDVPKCLFQLGGGCHGF